MHKQKQKGVQQKNASAANKARADKIEAKLAQLAKYKSELDEQQAAAKAQLVALTNKMDQVAGK